MGTNCTIQRIKFRRDVPKIAQLIGEGFESVLVDRGIDFNEYLRFAKQKHISLLFSFLHPFLSNFLEVFVQTHGTELEGTGTVQRVHFSDKTRWLLCNFAISRERSINLGTIVTMRSLMRRAIAHAYLKGAVEISAYIREDNKATYALCKSEGFEVIDEHSYYMLSPTKIYTIQQAPSSYQGILLNKLKPSPIETLTWFAIKRLFEFQKSVFVAKLEGNTMAEIHVTTHPGSESAHQLEIRPFRYLNQELTHALILSGLTIVSNNERRGILIVFSTGCKILKQVMEENGIPEVFKRNLLVLKP